MSAEIQRPPQPPHDGGLARTVAVTTGALLAARVVALVAGIVTLGLASRYLRVSLFGALTVGMAYASLFAVVADLGLSTVATREIAREPSHESHVLGNVLGIGLVLAGLAAVIGFVAMELAYSGAHNAPTRQAIEILLLQVLAAPIVGAARAFFTARQRGYLIALGDLALAGGMAVFTTIAVVSHLGFRAVVIAITGGYIAQAVVMAAVALASGARVRYDRSTSVALIKVAIPLGGVLLLNYVYFRLDVLLLSWLSTNASVARYGLAYRVIEGFMVLPGYVMLALFPAIVRSEKAQDSLAGTIGLALAALEALALLTTALVAIFSPEIVVVLGGHRYASAASVLAILAIAMGVSYLAGVYGNALMALGYQRPMFRLMMVTVGVNLVANLALIPPLGPDGAATAVVLSEIVGLILIRRLYVRVAGPVAPPPHLKILGAGLSLALLAAVKFALPLNALPLVVVSLGSLLGSLMYAAVLLRLGALPPPIMDRLPLPRWLVRIVPRP